MFLAVLRFYYCCRVLLKTEPALKITDCHFQDKRQTRPLVGTIPSWFTRAFWKGRRKKVFLQEQSLGCAADKPDHLPSHFAKHTLKNLTMRSKQFSDFKYILEEINYARERGGETQWNPSFLNSNPNGALPSIVSTGICSHYKWSTQCICF